MPCLCLEHSKSLISTQKYIKNSSKAYNVQPNPPPALSFPAPPTSLLPGYTLSTLPLLMLDWALDPPTGALAHSTAALFAGCSPSLGHSSPLPLHTFN